MAVEKGIIDGHDITARHILKQHSLLSQWLILSIALIVIGCNIGWNIFLEHERTLSNEQERLLSQARVLQENIGQNLLATRDVLVGLRQYLPKGIADKDLINRLQILTDAIPGIRTLAIIDASGTWRASNRKELIGKNFGSRDYFNVPRQQPDEKILYVTPPYKSILGTYTLSISTIIPGHKGEFAGVVMAALDPSYFAPLLDSVLYAPDMWVTVNHGEGLLFMMRPEIKELEGKIYSPGSFFFQHKNSGKEYTVHSGTSSLTGDSRLLVIRTVEPAGLMIPTPLLVGVSRNRSAIFANWRNDSLKFAALYLIIVLISILGLFFFQRRQRQFSKQATEALKQSEERFKAQYQGNPMATFTWQKKGDDFELIEFNKAADAITEGKAIALVGWKASELYADQQDMLQDIQRCFVEKETIRREIQSKHFLPGRRISIVIAFVPADLVIVYLEDVTDRKQIDELTSRLAAIVQSSKDAIIGKNLDGTITSWNKGAEKIYGYTESEVIGKSISILVPPDIQNELPNLLKKVELGESIESYETVRRRKDGQDIHISLTVSPIHDAEGRIVAAATIARDITDHKEAEIEKEYLITQLQESLGNIKTLSGLLPICSSCKKIRDDKGYWNQLESYISEHTETLFSHSYCPDCAKKLRNEIGDIIDKREQ